MGNEVLILKLLEALLKGSLILPDLILQSLDLTFHVNGIPYKYKGFEAAAMAGESPAAWITFLISPSSAAYAANSCT